MRRLLDGTHAARVLGLVSMMTLARCGGGQHASAPPPQLEELSLEAVPVHPNDTAAPAPGSADSERARVVRHAIDARHAAVAQCYAGILLHARDAVGRIVVEMLFAPSGHVDRVSARTEGEGGIGNARVCVENALRPTVVEGVNSVGLRVRWSYSFVNPVVEVAVPSPLEIAAPRRTRARPRPGASASPSTAPGGDATGALLATEITAALETHRADLENCFGTLLQRSRDAAGAATLTLSIAPDGTVADATLVSDVSVLSSMVSCVTDVARTLHFRGSGTPTSATVPLNFTH